MRAHRSNVQSSHLWQVVSAFMLSSSPLTVVGTFRSAGIAPWPVPDEKLFCRMSQEPARYLIIGFSPDEEILPTEDEIDQAATELYFEQCADTVAEVISSEAE
jgi:hypothetical protein